MDISKLPEAHAKLQVALAKLPLVASQDDLDDLPNGSIIFCEHTESDGEPYFLIKDESERLYLGAPWDWFQFETNWNVEIVLLEDVTPVLPAIIIFRGESD